VSNNPLFVIDPDDDNDPECLALLLELLAPTATTETNGSPPVETPRRTRKTRRHRSTKHRK